MVAHDERSVPDAGQVELGPVMGAIEQMRRLTEPQKAAALESKRDVVVTAGAGSGKTLTLVARYLALLERGVHPRRILAITFTEKAALEMRSRVRTAVTEAADQMSDPEARERWLDLEATMDSARIGTIHSFCAEVLRAHPAEAGLDPSFEVIEEGISAQLKAQAADDALSWLADASESDRKLFEAASPQGLRDLTIDLLKRRLDADGVLRSAPTMSWADLLASTVRGFIELPDVVDAVGAILDMANHDELVEDAGDKLAPQLEALLAGWADMEAHAVGRRGLDAAVSLHHLRRSHMALNVGKRASTAKGHLRRLRTCYDEHAAPWLGGTKADDGPDPHADASFAAAEQSLRKLYERASNAYDEALSQRRAVDFDTLEGESVQLLEIDAIGRRWRDTFDAVLVDEFQDTNRRQVRIVEALRGETPGRVFLVGDARQSIYRFRGADVTAYRRFRDDLVDAGALHEDLDRSFRSHTRLLASFDAMLPPLMGDGEEDSGSFWVPYTRLVADSDVPKGAAGAPFAEVVLGIGSNAEGSRHAAARALADRLHELRDTGELGNWDGVALLFRASSSFEAYEQAFENASVPFVTVAGRGFYDRPEVRDVLSMLRALAQPWDDAAMAGLLRSPAIGLTDAGLYRLRCRDGSLHPFRPSLDGDLSMLDEGDRQRAARAAQILRELEPLVDRLSVAELLKRLVDRTDYRAVLSTSPLQRPWRNVDKLLADAHRSGLVRVREFLEYLVTLKDVGAREGEAPAEASGAVQLMTVHKAKGLQFPYVVLADASHQGGGGSGSCYLEPGLGAACKLDKLDGQPMAYRLARWRDGLQSDAESMRLLYVAMTRAEDKLLISGGATEGAKGLATKGWLKAVLDGVGFHFDVLESASEGVIHHELDAGVELRVFAPQSASDKAARASDRSEPSHGSDWPESAAGPLWELPRSQHDEPADADGVAARAEDVRDDEPERDWRATGGHRAPPEVIGRLVHRAIECWRFPGDDGYEQLVRAEAYREKLVDTNQRQQASNRVAQLLQRLRDDELWSVIDAADERHHELPFTARQRGANENAGVIDLLYRVGDKWQIVDFKTDAIHGEEVLAGDRGRYADQVRWYARSVRELLGVSPQIMLCFLDCEGAVHLEPIDAP